MESRLSGNHAGEVQKPLLTVYLWFCVWNNCSVYRLLIINTGVPEHMNNKLYQFRRMEGIRFPSDVPMFSVETWANESYKNGSFLAGPLTPSEVEGIRRWKVYSWLKDKCWAQWKVALGNWGAFPSSFYPRVKNECSCMGKSHVKSHVFPFRSTSHKEKLY